MGSTRGLWFSFALLVSVSLGTEIMVRQAAPRNDGFWCKAMDYQYHVKHIGCVAQYVTVKACLGECQSRHEVLDDYPYFKSVC
ncbi:hypothetical protein, partial [Salmonella sp. s54925]|uniref:hypothetical protein n=1 Tax=Salmonella sp. s54925 TaxID=3159674 RepID=UPI00397EB1E5